MKRYLKYVKPYWYAFILGPILMITEVAGEVILPGLSMWARPTGMCPILSERG